MILTLIFWFCVLFASIALLVKSADWFTDFAEKIGSHFGLSPFVIGVTIVAIGTSLPELISSVVAVTSGASEIVLGNALGSNIANIFLVLGFAGIFAKHAKFKHNNLILDLIYLMSATVIVALFLMDGVFSIIEALICISILVFYLLKSVKSKSSSKDAVKNKTLPTLTYLYLLLSGFGIYIAAKFLIDSVILISDTLGFPKELIGASIVAIGTSLPELTVSVAAARKGKVDIAIGNVIGSNIFNILGVIGVAALFGNLIVTSNILTFILPLTIIASVIFVFVVFDKKIKLHEGILLLFFYALFLIKLFI